MVSKIFMLSPQPAQVKRALYAHALYTHISEPDPLSRVVRRLTPPLEDGFDDGLADASESLWGGGGDNGGGGRGGAGGGAGGIDGGGDGM